jgi:protein gp37
MEYQARVFTCSISDFFIDHPAANSRRLGAWFVIRNTPNLTYLILTKRPHNILKMLPKDWGHGYPNVWLGTSVGCNLTMWRVDALRKVPVHPECVRFLSCEPLLEDIAPKLDLTGIGWVIAGGESGAGKHTEFVYSEKNWRDYFDANKTPNGRRTMKLEWAQKLLDMSRAAGLPFYFKQVTASQQHVGMDALGRIYREYPAPPAGKEWLADDDDTKQVLKLASPISWTHWPWNPWKGCIKVGPECIFCYIDRPSCGGGQFNIIQQTGTLNSPYEWSKQIALMASNQPPVHSLPQ